MKCQESAKIWPKISSYEANIADLSGKMPLGKDIVRVVATCFDWSPLEFPSGWELEVLLEKMVTSQRHDVFMSDMFGVLARLQYPKKDPGVEKTISGLIGSWLSAVKVRNAKPATSSATHTHQRS